MMTTKNFTQALNDAWEMEWSYSDSCVYALDADRVCVRGNPAARERFSIATQGNELEGTIVPLTPRPAVGVVVRDPKYHFPDPSIKTMQECWFTGLRIIRYRQKIADGYIVVIKYCCTQEELEQTREAAAQIALSNRINKCVPSIAQISRQYCVANGVTSTEVFPVGIRVAV